MKTFKNAGLSKDNSERGSALITVIILCGFTLMLIASYLMTHSNQAKLSFRATLQNEGRNAAEGVAEVALAELHRRSQANPSFGAGTNPDPLAGYSLSNAYKDFMAPTGNINSHVVKTSLEFKNSPLSNAPSAPAIIDSTDPVNSQDTSIDQTPLSIRSLNIFAKAAVLDPRTGQPITSYVSQNVQVRDQTWFNYAIFYNMDMEFHAGPDFTVFGPVHTNANAYLTEGDSNTLSFYSTLSAFGKLYRYDKYTGNTSGNHTGTVECATAGGMVTSNVAAMATNRDSRYASFNSYATTRWHGYVQDSTFSVAKFNPPGLKAYIPDDFTTSGTNELRNNGYIMIEPQLSQVSTHVDPYTLIDDYGYKGEDTENLKFSALSGFVIQVKPPATIGAQPQWQLVLYQATDITKRISADNPPARDGTTGLPVIATKINPFTDLDENQSPPGSGPGQGLAVIKSDLKAALLDAIVSIPYKDGGSAAGSVWGNGTSDLVKFNQTATEANSSIDYWPLYDRREGHAVSSGSDVWLDMQGAMHVLRINFAKLNALLNETAGLALWTKPYAPTSPWGATTAKVYDPALSYTGVVYVQVPLAPRVAARFAAASGSVPEGDKIRPAVRANRSSSPKTPGYAVVISNAVDVPQLSSGFNVPDGFTIATNAPIYIWGHFNADGNSGTGSSTTPDDANERPALIAGDSVTILSANNGFDFQNMPGNKGNAAAFTEISAAIMGGLVPTRPGVESIWSGGVHNLVRYLENWGGDDYRFRGSLGVIYESEVAKGTYNEGYNSFYDPPDRDLGYHQYLAQGRFPPATPIKRTVRRMNVRDITAAEYNTGPTTPPAVN